jgi:hypothetical protein
MVKFLKITIFNYQNFFKKWFTTCFGPYGHQQVLNFLWCGNCCAHLVLFLVWSHVCTGASLNDGPLSVSIQVIVTHRDNGPLQRDIQVNEWDHTRFKTKWAQQFLHYKSLMHIGQTCTENLFKVLTILRQCCI